MNIMLCDLFLKIRHNPILIIFFANKQPSNHPCNGCKAKAQARAARPVQYTREFGGLLRGSAEGT